ncbi:DUF484 family protein [Gammaproteobacteria bacterium]|nr:DUF484 family protein [Gammaproteobacteria bacterium]
MDQKLTSKEVELYLLENTEFFLSRESLVGELSFKHDIGEASSLLEMQVKRLRDEQTRLMEMLTNFVSTGQDNANLFLKSKALTLSLIQAKNLGAVIAIVENFFKEVIGADQCKLELASNTEIQKLEVATSLEMNKNSIHMGPLSKEKMHLLFGDTNMLSGVICVFTVNHKFGLLKIGSTNQTKYLGDGDTTFIEYIRDVIASIIELKDA